jgi:hypothetical protein
MPVESAFRALVDREVTLRLAKPTDWAALLGSLPSIYPETVLSSVQRLGLSERVLRVAPTKGEGGRASFAANLWSEGRLATPHIIDGSWWFADAALEELWHVSQQLSRKNGPVLMLGTPSLFHFFTESGAGESPVLIDRCLRGVCRPIPGRAIELDLLEGPPIRLGTFAVVVADPPWYNAETRAFLVAARLNAEVGSRIVLSVPPVGTRPGIEQEWNELVLWAEGIGLQLIDYAYARLPYMSPLFEENALRAAGIPPCPLDWRKGDLAIFSCFDTLNLPSDSQHCAPEKWEEVNIGRVTIRVRSTTEETTNGATRLRSLVAGNVLPSVSRRHHLVESVGVWTSGNRVFGLEAASVAHAVLHALAAEGRSSGVKGSGWIKKGVRTLGLDEVETTLRNIVETEEGELLNWRDRADGKLVHHTA